MKGVLIMICKKGYEIMPLETECGEWYMGTKHKTDGPQCRLTEFTYSREMAVRIPLYRQFYCAANENCNGGSGCFE